MDDELDELILSIKESIRRKIIDNEMEVFSRDMLEFWFGKKVEFFRQRHVYDSINTMRGVESKVESLHLFWFDDGDEVRLLFATRFEDGSYDIDIEDEDIE